VAAAAAAAEATGKEAAARERGDGGGGDERGGHSGGSEGRGVEGGRRWWWQGWWGRWSIGKCTGLAFDQHGGLAVRRGSLSLGSRNIAKPQSGGLLAEGAFKGQGLRWEAQDYTEVTSAAMATTALLPWRRVGVGLDGTLHDD